MGAEEEEEARRVLEREASSVEGRGPITPSQFVLWKQRKDAEAAAKAAELARKREEDIAAGRVQMNGRELYLHEPWVFDDSRDD